MVVNDAGECPAGAEVDVVRGQRAGQRFSHDASCNFYSGGLGVVFKDLTHGEEMVLRGSSPGYQPTEKTVVPMFNQQLQVDMTLRRIQ